MSVLINDTLSKHSLIFLLTAIGLITLPHALHIPALLFGFFAILLAWRFLAVWHNHWMPNKLVLLMLTSIGMLLLYSQHHGLFGRDGGTPLFVVAMGLKLLEIRTVREVYLVVFLAFIVAASQFLYEQSILMAGYILLVCTGMLATLIIQNSRQPQTLDALKTALAIIAQALPLALVIFVFFPRLEAPHWHWLEDESKAKSGLSNTLEPGSISDLSLSDELVFRVNFIGEPPPPKLRYWRGPIYSFTDGKRWIAPSLSNFKLQQSVPHFSGLPYTYNILLEPQKEAWVFALEMAGQFDTTLHRNSLYQLISNKNTAERAEYKISSYPLYNTGELSQTEEKDNLQLPEQPNAKLYSLVKKLQGFDAAPEIFIQNLLKYFHAEDFHYTLTPPLMPDNPIESFLFDYRSGFCSHYATAFVYLLRVAQIPARVIGGYQGGEFNKLGGFLEVRQADAHAWAEVWLSGKGWVRFDPTAAIAPERIERGVNIDLQIASGIVNFGAANLDAQSLSWLKRGRQLWQNVDYKWQRWVINYDTINQAKFFAGLGISDWYALAKWLLFSLVFISLVLSWQLLENKQRNTDRELRYYRQFCQKMAKADAEIKLGEGAKDFAERAKLIRPDLAEQIDLISGIFIKLHYHPKADPKDYHYLKKRVGKLKV